MQLAIAARCVLQCTVVAGKNVDYKTRALARRNADSRGHHGQRPILTDFPRIAYNEWAIHWRQDVGVESSQEKVIGMLMVSLVPHRRFALIVCLLIACGPTAALAQFEFPSGLSGLSGTGSSREVAFDAQFTPAEANRPALLFVTAQIPDGFHVYAVDQAVLPDNGGGPMATAIDISANTAVKLLGPWQPIEPPHTHTDKETWVGLELREHAEQVTWVAPIALAPGTDVNSLSIAVAAEGQACNPQTCIPFEQSFTAVLGEGKTLSSQLLASLSLASPNSASPATETDDSSLLVILCYGMLGGLILNLMPCVLPVIGLKVLSFAKQGGLSRTRILTLNLFYVAGLLTVFMVLASLAALAQLGLGEESFGWGELYTLTWFKVSMTCLVFAMALSFLGIWELPIPGFASSGKATELAAKEGPMGAYCMGLFTTILATPCSGPFLGPVFGYTISQSPLIIYSIFGSVGLGMALPYLVIGAFPALVSWLPKPGAWMDTLKNLMGFILLATVVYLFSTLSHDYFIATLSLLFGIWFACWMIGRTPITASSSQRRNAWIEGSATAAIIGALAFHYLTPSESLLPWQPFSPQAVVVARDQGKTVMVDFTAQWCPTCKVNLSFAINRPKVKKWVEENDVVTLIADWTDRNDVIKQALLELNSQSIPLLAIYPADPAAAPIVLPDLLTTQIVLDALAQAMGQDDSLSGSSSAGQTSLSQAAEGEPRL